MQFLSFGFHRGQPQPEKQNGRLVSGSRLCSRGCVKGLCAYWRNMGVPGTVPLSVELYKQFREYSVYLPALTLRSLSLHTKQFS